MFNFVSVNYELDYIDIIENEEDYRLIWPPLIKQLEERLDPIVHDSMSSKQSTKNVVVVEQKET